MAEPRKMEEIFGKGYGPPMIVMPEGVKEEEIFLASNYKISERRKQNFSKYKMSNLK